MKLKKFLLLMSVISAVIIFPVHTFASSEQFVTRKEFSRELAAVLREKGFMGKSRHTIPFVDITQENECYNDIVLLKELSIIQGDENGNFRPNDYILYQEAAAMVSRIVASEDIIKGLGGYPIGYLKMASKKGLFKGINASVTTEMKRNDLQKILENVENSIKIYDCMERLGCDVTYNGDVYIDYYPKEWQGFERVPVANSNGYFNILPGKLLYSYDKKIWNTAYEDIDGKRVYYNLPDNITGVRYSESYNRFVSVPYYPHISKEQDYSYDYKTWHRGVIDGTLDTTIPVDYENYILGLPAPIISDSISGLYFSWYPYEEYSYTSKRYNVEFTMRKNNLIWASKNAVEWIGIKIPDEVKFFESAYLIRRGQALIITCAVDFTEEEQEYIDNEEKIAEKLKKGYDKPSYKRENYILRFSEVNKLFE